MDLLFPKMRNILAIQEIIEHMSLEFRNRTGFEILIYGEDQSDGPVCDSVISEHSRKKKESESLNLEHSNAERSRKYRVTSQVTEK